VDLLVWDLLVVEWVEVIRLWLERVEPIRLVLLMLELVALM
jgi:hypothetical protein